MRSFSTVAERPFPVSRKRVIEMKVFLGLFGFVALLLLECVIRSCCGDSMLARMFFFGTF